MVAGWANSPKGGWRPAYGRSQDGEIDELEKKKAGSAHRHKLYVKNSDANYLPRGERKGAGWGWGAEIGYMGESGK